MAVVSGADSPGKAARRKRPSRNQDQESSGFFELPAEKRRSTACVRWNYQVDEQFR